MFRSSNCELFCSSYCEYNVSQFVNCFFVPQLVNFMLPRIVQLVLFPRIETACFADCDLSACFHRLWICFHRLWICFPQIVNWVLWTGRGLVFVPQIVNVCSTHWTCFIECAPSVQQMVNASPTDCELSFRRIWTFACSDCELCSTVCGLLLHNAWTSFNRCDFLLSQITTWCFTGGVFFAFSFVFFRQIVNLCVPQTGAFQIINCPQIERFVHRSWACWVHRNCVGFYRM